MIATLISFFHNFGIFIIVLGILVIVHEWGHFITAKKLGVQVDEFAIGFGPTLFKKHFNGTTYMLKLLPLGGYVKMAGDERNNCTGNPQEFFSKSPGHRALIVLNGPVVNYALAYVCLVFVFMMGYPDLSNKVGEIMNKYPAQIAGLEIGDQLIEIEGKKISNWTDLQNAIHQSKNNQINVTYNRNGEIKTTVIAPKIEKLKNIFGQEKETRIIGVRPAPSLVSLKYGPIESVGLAGAKLWEITSMTYKSLFFMMTGAISAKETMTGPVGLFDVVKMAAEMGFVHLVFITGLISASLAIFNLLPLLPLDGGHLLLLGIEKLRRKPLSPKIDESFAKVGFALIISLALFVTFNDIDRKGGFDLIKNHFQPKAVEQGDK